MPNTHAGICIGIKCICICGQPDTLYSVAGQKIVKWKKNIGRAKRNDKFSKSHCDWLFGYG